jgi:hypothetical protein
MATRSAAWQESELAKSSFINRFFEASGTV